MIITSFYGMEFKPDVKTQRAYEKKRQACIELLGKNYLLAEPLTKKEIKNDKKRIDIDTYVANHQRRS